MSEREALGEMLKLMDHLIGKIQSRPDCKTAHSILNKERAHIHLRIEQWR